MPESVFVLCAAFLILVFIYWIMPINKMKAVNESLKSLLQILPISKIIDSINKKTN